MCILGPLVLCAYTPPTTSSMNEPPRYGVRSPRSPSSIPRPRSHLLQTHGPLRIRVVGFGARKSWRSDASGSSPSRSSRHLRPPSSVTITFRQYETLGVARVSHLSTASAAFPNHSYRVPPSPFPLSFFRAPSPCSLLSSQPARLHDHISDTEGFSFEEVARI